MVPVGGAIIAGFDKSVVEEVAASYPGKYTSVISRNINVIRKNCCISQDGLQPHLFWMCSLHCWVWGLKNTPSCKKHELQDLRFFRLNWERLQQSLANKLLALLETPFLLVRGIYDNLILDLSLTILYSALGITLTQFGNNLPEGLRLSRLTMLGSMLFTRHVFGARVVTGKESKIIDGFEFNGKFVIGRTRDVPIFHYLIIRCAVFP